MKQDRSDVDQQLIPMHPLWAIYKKLSPKYPFKFPSDFKLLPEHCVVLYKVALTLSHPLSPSLALSFSPSHPLSKPSLTLSRPVTHSHSLIGAVRADAHGQHPLHFGYRVESRKRLAPVLKLLSPPRADHLGGPLALALCMK